MRPVATAPPFGIAFAYTAQVEILVTIALIFVFQKQGWVKKAENMIDIGLRGATGVLSKEQAAELQNATTATASLTGQQVV